MDWKTKLRDLLSQRGRVLTERVETLVGLSDIASVRTQIDGKVFVEFTVNLNIKHLMELEEDKQVIHVIETSKDRRWLPTLSDLDRLSAYSRLLRLLCDKKESPSKEVIRELHHLRNPKMSKVLRTIYGEKTIRRFLLIVQQSGIAIGSRTHLL